MPLSNQTLKTLSRAVRQAKEDGFEMWGFCLSPHTGEWANFGCEGISREDFAQNTLNMVKEFSTRHKVEHVKVADA